MSYKYRAYQGATAFSSHDSTMPAQTWSKIRNRKDAREPITNDRRDIATLKTMGWYVKRVEIKDYPRPSDSKEFVLQSPLSKDRPILIVGGLIWLLALIIGALLILAR